MTNNVRINYDEIVTSIGKEIAVFMSELRTGASGGDIYCKKLIDLLKGVSFEVSDEQSDIKRKDLTNQNIIHVVAKFGNSSTNFGSSICPVVLNILGVENKIKPAQMFFSAFCTRWHTYNMIDSNGVVNDKITQLWMTPNVVANFNEVSIGYRTLFNVSGTLIIGQSTVKLGTMTYVYDPDLFASSQGEEGYENIDFLSFQDNFTNALSPQPFGDTFGFAKSETNFSTNSFSISTYLLDTKLVADCMAVKGFRYRNKPEEWLFNDTVNIPLALNTFSYPFVSNGEHFSSIKTELVGSKRYIYYDDTWVYNTTDGWSNEEYKKIVFDKPVANSNSQALYNLISSNATKKTYESTKSPNDNFIIYLSFTNGYTNFPIGGDFGGEDIRTSSFFNRYKCSSFTIGQKLGEIPTYNISFAK